MPNSQLAERTASEVRGQMARQRRTQGELAAVLGMSQAAVSRRLYGHVEFNVSELIAVAEFLGVPAALLLPAAVA